MGILWCSSTSTVTLLLVIPTSLRLSVATLHHQKDTKLLRSLLQFLVPQFVSRLKLPILLYPLIPIPQPAHPREAQLRRLALERQNQLMCPRHLPRSVRLLARVVQLEVQLLCRRLFRVLVKSQHGRRKEKEPRPSLHLLSQPGLLVGTQARLTRPRLLLPGLQAEAQMRPIGHPQAPLPRSNQAPRLVKAQPQLRVACSQL